MPLPWTGDPIVRGDPIMNETDTLDRRRWDDLVDTLRSRLSDTFASKAEVASVKADQAKQHTDMAVLKSELHAIRLAVEKLSSHLERGTWVILTAVILAVMGLVLL